MQTSADDLNNIIAREKIRDCLARLARGLDRRDADMVRACYWPDATDDHGVAVSTVEEFVSWVSPGDPAMILTLHTLGQSYIEFRGDTGLAETHVTAYHRVDVGGQHRDIFLGGRYLDRMEKRDTEWRIAHHKMMYDWQNDLGPSADFSQGTFGMPFVSENPVGAAHGDFSERFFK